MEMRRRRPKRQFATLRDGKSHYFHDSSDSDSDLSTIIDSEMPNAGMGERKKLFKIFGSLNSTKRLDILKEHFTDPLETSNCSLPKRMKHDQPIDDSPTSSPDEDNTPAPFEELPQELVREILDRAPEALLPLKKTSLTMKSHVDSYVEIQKPRISVVESINIIGCESDKSKIRVVLIVPAEKFYLFEKRLDLPKRNCPENSLIRSLNFDRTSYYGIANAYTLTFDKNQPFVNEVELIVELNGKRINQIHLINIHHRKALFRNLLPLFNGSVINKLTISPFKGTQISINDLRVMINRPNHVLRLELVVKTVPNSIDPVNLLLEIASCVKCLKVEQLRIKGRDHHENMKPYFFGVRNIKWAPVILDMFQRKLDTLFFSNLYCPEFLDSDDKYTIQEGLVNSGKKLWFKSDVTDYTDEVKYVDGGYSIKVKYQSADEEELVDEDKIYHHTFFSIKHSSRQKKKWDY